MYLDEEDALRPVSTKPSSSRAAWLGGGAVLLVVIAGGLVAALTGHDDETPVATALEAETPAVAPRSQGELVAPTPAPSAAPSDNAPSENALAKPVPAPIPSAAPTPANVVPKVPAVPKPAPVQAARPSTREAHAGSAQTDLLQQLTERAGEFAVEARKPAAPELSDAPVVAPTRAPELSDEPVEVAPRIVPELNDEPPLD